MLIPTLLLLPPLIETAPANVTASIVLASVALTVSAPPAEIAASDAPLLSIFAVVEPPIVLNANPPPTAPVMFVPLPAATATAPPSEKAWMPAAIPFPAVLNGSPGVFPSTEVAVTVMSPSVVTLESRISASTVGVTLLTATETPTATEPFVPLPNLPERPSAPEMARIALVSWASTSIAALVGSPAESAVVTPLDRISAAVLVVIELPEPEPAPANAKPLPEPPLKLPATPIVTASTVAFSVAVTSRPPGVSKSETVSTIAWTELLIELIATAAPTLTLPLEPEP
jgi:hypothetical protein